MSSRTLSRTHSFTRLIAYCALPLMAACGSSGCGGDDDNATVKCVEALPQTCEPDLDPVFDSLYTSVFSQRCGSTDSGTNCHGKNANPGSNLKLTDANTAYQALLGQNGATARVIPGDTHCSPLMERLESDDPNYRMPRLEAKLSEGVRCAIQQWIEKGAPR